MAVSDTVGVHGLSDVREKLLNGVWDTWADSSSLMVEDVFSTMLYTGNGTTQTVTTGIDLTGAASGNLMQGGMVWIKKRGGSESHALLDTSRGPNIGLSSNATTANNTLTSSLTAYTSTGITLGSHSWVNSNTDTYASWNFRRAKKFFDIVTYTGNGVSGRQIAHNLGIKPGLIIVKRTSGLSDWTVYHTSLGATKNINLNEANASSTTLNWNNVEPTATVFTVGSDADVNQNSDTYVAYLFAHDDSANGIIQCGSVTTDGSGNATVNLGWEPAWMLYKPDAGSTGWVMQDELRGFNVTNNAALLPHSLNAEATFTSAKRTTKGFTLTTAGTTPVIYMAIRRGPMRVPSDGTNIFQVYNNSNTVGSTSAVPLKYSSGMQSDMVLARFDRNTGAPNTYVVDNLRGYISGAAPLLTTNTTNAEASPSSGQYVTRSEALSLGPAVSLNLGIGSNQYVWYAFRRAPGFFDQVAYTGDGTQGRQIPHNLGAVPTMIWLKRRNSSESWYIYHAATNIDPGQTDDKLSLLFSTSYELTYKVFKASQSATTINLSAATLNMNGINAAASTYTAYLFGDVPGVSKAFSYSGNGTNQTINLGFAPRFVMVKQTNDSSIANWYIWDSARGIVTGNDPYIIPNSTATEVTTDDSVDPVANGIIVNQTATTNINVTSATYVGYAIA